MTLVSDVKTTTYWREEFFGATYGNLSNFRAPSTTLRFPDGALYIVLPSVLLSVYRVDDLGDNYSAQDARSRQVGLELLNWFFTEEQNIEFVKSSYYRWGYLHPSLSQEDQIAATRAAPVPSAVPLGYSLFGLDCWRQQYVTEDIYFGEV